MMDLSKYLHEYRPNVKYAILMDNATVHDIISELPFQNLDFVMLPPRTTAYLQVRSVGNKCSYQNFYLNNCIQPCDTLYNAVFKLKHKLAIEKYLIDLHFDNKKVSCNDENAAYLAADVYYQIQENVVQDWVFR